MNLQQRGKTIMNNKKYFSVKLFINNFLQLKLMGILSTVLIALFSTIMLVIEGMSCARATIESGKLVQVSITGNDMVILLFIVGVCTPVLMLMAFSCFNKRDSADFYGALPFTRLNMYLTKIAAVFAWQLIVQAVSVIGITVTIGVYHRYFIYSASSIAMIMLGIFVCNLVCGASIALACALTGNLVSNICVAGLIMFLPVAVKTLLELFIRKGFKYAADSSVVPFISDGKNLLTNGVLNVFGYGRGSLTELISADRIIYSMILAVIYAVIGYLVFAIRKSEIAGKASSGNKVQFVVRAIIGFFVIEIGILDVIGDYFRSMDYDYEFYAGDCVIEMIIFIAVAVAAIFLYELLTGEKSRIIKNSAISLGTSLIVVLLFTCGAVAGLSAMRSYKVEASEVSHVRVALNTSNYYHYSIEYYQDKTRDINISDDRCIQLLADAYNSADINTSSPKLDGTYVDVYFKDGLLGRYRSVYITSQDYEKFLGYLGEVKEYQQVYTKLPDYSTSKISTNANIELSDEDMKKLYECLKNELAQVDFAEYMKGLYSSGASDSFYIVFVDDGKEYEIRIYMNTTLPKTTKMFMEMCNATSLKQSKDSIDYYNTAIKMVEDVYKTGAVSGYNDDWYIYVSMYYIDLVKNEQNYLLSGSNEVNEYATQDQNAVTYENYSETVAAAIDGMKRVSSQTQIDISKPIYQVDVTIQKTNSTSIADKLAYRVYYQ